MSIEESAELIHQPEPIEQDREESAAIEQSLPVSVQSPISNQEVMIAQILKRSRTQGKDIANLTKKVETLAKNLSDMDKRQAKRVKQLEVTVRKTQKSLESIKPKAKRAASKKPSRKIKKAHRSRRK